MLEKHLLIRHGGLWPRGQRWREEGGEGKHRWCLASRRSCGARAVRWARGDVGEWGWGMARQVDVLRGSVSRREAGGLPWEGAGGAGAGAWAAVVLDRRTEGESRNPRLL